MFHLPLATLRRSSLSAPDFQRSSCSDAGLQCQHLDPGVKVKRKKGLDRLKKDGFSYSGLANLRPAKQRKRQIASLDTRVRNYAVANFSPIRYASCHEDDLESSLVVARRNIGGQRSVML
ncbi:hypothetical protein ABLO27_03340 [Roseibium sp. SCPC15]|uniref:hypothetical protein n=1 Tax=Roseibium sp. SCP15 TaxID=3141376 RepID=UPI00333A8602